MAPVFDSNQSAPDHARLQQALSPLVSTNDRGFLYGDGVFETVRCSNAQLLLWTLHRDRLIRSCEALAIPLYIDELDQLVSASLVHAPAHDCIIKIIVTRGEGGRGYAPPKTPAATIVLQWHMLPDGISLSSQQGIECMFCTHPLSLNPVTAGIKHLNRLDQVMASLQLSQAAEHFPAVKEGLMCDLDGYVVEGTRSNIFAVIDKQLCTPDLSRAGVQGVMRGFVIDQLNALGIATEIRPVHKQELRLASELFVCNSVLGIWPVNRILHLEGDATGFDVRFTDRRIADVARIAAQELFPL